MVLSLTGASTDGGIAYQWQASTNGGTTYTNIAGATGATYTVTGQTRDDAVPRRGDLHYQYAVGHFDGCHGHVVAAHLRQHSAHGEF